MPVNGGDAFRAILAVGQCDALSNAGSVGRLPRDWRQGDAGRSPGGVIRILRFRRNATPVHAGAWIPIRAWGQG